MFSRIKIFFKKLFNSEVLALGCRHKTKIKGEVEVFLDRTMVPRKLSMLLYLDDKGNASHCFKCIESASIRCALCGCTILPGHPISLYSSTNRKNILPIYAVEYNLNNNDRRSYIRCLGCAVRGADMYGYWGIDKKVHN